MSFDDAELTPVVGDEDFSIQTIRSGVVDFVWTFTLDVETALFEKKLSDGLIDWDAFHDFVSLFLEVRSLSRFLDHFGDVRNRGSTLDLLSDYIPFELLSLSLSLFTTVIVKFAHSDVDLTPVRGVVCTEVDVHCPDDVGF